MENSVWNSWVCVTWPLTGEGPVPHERINPRGRPRAFRIQLSPLVSHEKSSFHDCFFKCIDSCHSYKCFINKRRNGL